MKLLARGREIVFPRSPIVMGIVNLSADSFSGDGCPDVDSAVRRALELARDGAEIIDLGAESARTNRGAISEQEETDRLCAFVHAWRASAGGPAALLSINTWRPSVARAVLREGGNILNDIGGLATDENARICADLGAALVIMHTVGEPKVPHTHLHYENVMERLDAFFTEKMAAAASAALPPGQIVLDPGIDFAKQRDNNLRIYRDLADLSRFQRPILLPVSRKTVVGDVLGLPPHERDPGTVACIVAGILRGASILRVHNVKAAIHSIRMIGAVSGENIGMSSFNYRQGVLLNNGP